jgi:hypothetical protein
LPTDRPVHPGRLACRRGGDRPDQADGGRGHHPARSRAPARQDRRPAARGDKLLTGKTGRIALTFIDDTRFAVGPNSNIDISRFDYDRRAKKGEFLTQVNRGSLAVVSGQIAKSRRDAMKVRTPKTWLGVRGTRFVVTVP